MFGRDEDTGEVLAFTRLGILEDLLGCATPDDFPTQMREWMNGRVPLHQVAIDMLKAPTNELAGGLGLYLSYPYTLLSDKEPWPETPEGSYVTDKWEWLARSLGGAAEFRAITDRPSRPYAETFDEMMLYR